MSAPRRLNEVLLSEFARRRQRNRAYSLRAFARDLGIGKTSLADTLAGKRRLSVKAEQKVCAHLDIDPEELARSDESRVLAGDDFQLIADWYHYGILSVAKLPEHRADARWLS